MASNNRKIYIAAADNLSKLKAYEYAKDFDFEITGESGYVFECVRDVCDNDTDTVICSQKLFDGNAKTLYSMLVKNQKPNVNVLVMTHTQNKTLCIKRLDKKFLHRTGKNNAIDSTLSMINMPSTLKGYQLFKSALTITLMAPNTLCDITHSVYEQVAKSHNVDIKNVEYNMRTAKNHSMLHCQLQTYHEIFGISDDAKQPTLGEFLSSLTAYIIRTY